ncbi:MAG: sugar phosphate isomerase/epimerase [Catalinimonas sp.]
MDRRHFIRTGALATAALSLGACTNQPHKPELGVILNTLRKEMRVAPRATLRRVRALGYRYVEWSDTFGLPRRTLSDMVREADLLPVAGGGVMVDMRGDGLNAYIEQAQADGKAYVVCYWPWMDEGHGKKLDDGRRLAETLNQMGERCRAAGLRFAMHNHDKEFARDGGQTVYDAILEGTDPALVTMEMDTYWVARGGADPVDYLRRYPGRFELMHAKDMARGAARDKASVGTGVLDFAAVVKLSERAGLRYAIVEHDGADDPLASITRSATYLKTIL